MQAGMDVSSMWKETVEKDRRTKHSTGRGTSFEEAWSASLKVAAEPISYLLRPMVLAVLIACRIIPPPACYVAVKRWKDHALDHSFTTWGLPHPRCS